MKSKDLNKFKGCLFGGAVGDAFGYAVEFMNIEQIRELYGSDGITQLQLVGGKALISDDTQMTLFTANGILVGMTNEHLQGVRRSMERYLHNAYMDWKRTQRLITNATASVSSWIYNVGAMHCVRAPGGTCLRSLATGLMGTLDHPINSSKGCGGIMRVSPIGLYFDPAHYDPANIDMLGAKSAALTHGHPLGFLPAAALVHLINQCVYGSFAGDDALYDIAADTIQALGVEFGNYEKTAFLQDLLRKAVDLSKQEGLDVAQIAKLGEGWVAEEALAISLYCALKYRNDFEQALIAAINHSGDSDSTGSITGNILGTYLGYNSIPSYLLEHLELSGVIREISEDLFRDSSAVNFAHCKEEKWQKKYVKAEYKI
ncbi:MAG: ADP-ribosylglycohydrolase family protein [Clostridia bacterium]